MFSKNPIKIEDSSEMIDEPKICIFCPRKIFTSLEAVKQYHNYTWNLCKYCTLIKSKLFEQISEPQNEVYFCYYCLATELKFEDLIFHLKEHCKVETCVCPGESWDVEDFKIYIKEDSSPPRKISANNSHDIHASSNHPEENLSHTIEKQRKENPFHCDQCDFKTSQTSYIKIHMRKHTGEKPFNCDHCGYKCSQRGNLVRHMQIHTGEKPFQCNKCELKFAKRCNLIIHVRHHTGEKPFHCDQCEFKASRLSSLKTHILNHTGEKPYHCDQCDFKTFHKSSLTNHKYGQKHTGEIPFRCNQCEFITFEKNSLINHMQEHKNTNQFAD